MEYALTADGRELAGALHLLAEWGVAARRRGRAAAPRAVRDAAPGRLALPHLRPPRGRQPAGRAPAPLGGRGRLPVSSPAGPSGSPSGSRNGSRAGPAAPPPPPPGTSRGGLCGRSLRPGVIGREQGTLPAEQRREQWWPVSSRRPTASSYAASWCGPRAGSSRAAAAMSCAAASARSDEDPAPCEPSGSRRATPSRTWAAGPRRSAVGQHPFDASRGRIEVAARIAREDGRLLAVVGELRIVVSLGHAADPVLAARRRAGSSPRKAAMIWRMYHRRGPPRDHLFLDAELGAVASIQSHSPSWSAASIALPAACAPSPRGPAAARARSRGV